MDLPSALEQLTKEGRIYEGDDWGPCANTGDSYESFAKGWRGMSDVPTEGELISAWKTVTTARPELLLSPQEQRKRIQTPVRSIVELLVQKQIMSQEEATNLLK